MSRSLIRITKGLCVGALMFLSFGCVMQTDNKPRTSEAKRVSQGHVLRIEGEAILLGQSASNPLTRTAFLARVGQLQTLGRSDEVGELVALYPDLAEQAVLANDPRGAHLLGTIAIWLDTLAAPDPGGWASLVANRLANPQEHELYRQQRADLWSAMQRGAFRDVAGMNLTIPASADSPWLEVDAANLKGTASLAAGQPAQAVGSFQRAAELAAPWDSTISHRLSLFSALALRLSGQPDRAMIVRNDVFSTIELDQVSDPMLLRLALETSTDSAESIWVSRINDRQLRACLARIELNRGAPQTALLLWRAAENDPGNKPSRDHLRLAQAEALIALGQTEPAIAMLTGLAKGQVRPEALTMLGLLQLQRGQVELAMALLQEAVRSTTAASHPSVYADAGLALLSVGDAKRGLSLLSDAKIIYRARDDYSSLRRALLNELRYANAMGDVEHAKTVREEIAQLPGVELRG